MVKKRLVFLLCLTPLVWLLYQAITGAIGPDPGKDLVLFTGIWAFRFLIITLAISPIRQLTRFKTVGRYRRMFGLYVWFYASLHFLAVLTYLLGWSWAIFLEEFSERPYMAVGITAWVLLVPLGLTSNRWAIKQLGRHWVSLHKLVYVIAMLVCAHFIWLIRADYWQAAVYCLFVVLLLLYRFVSFFNSRAKLSEQIASP